MKASYWIMMLVASGLTGTLGYHWGQSTERQAGIERKAVAERDLLAKQRSDPNSQQWDKLNQDLTYWAAHCTASDGLQEQISNCMMKNVAQQQMMEFVQTMLHQQQNRPPDLTFPSESKDWHR